MTFKVGDQIRLKDYPTAVGEVTSRTGGTVLVRFPFSPPGTSNAIRLDAIELVPYQIKPGDLIRYKWRNYTETPTNLTIVQHVEDFDRATIIRAWTPTESGDFKLVHGGE